LRNIESDFAQLISSQVNEKNILVVSVVTIDKKSCWEEDEDSADLAVLRTTWVNQKRAKKVYKEPVNNF